MRILINKLNLVPKLGAPGQQKRQGSSCQMQSQASERAVPCTDPLHRPAPSAGSRARGRRAETPVRTRSSVLTDPPEHTLSCNTLACLLESRCPLSEVQLNNVHCCFQNLGLKVTGGPRTVHGPRNCCAA